MKKTLSTLVLLMAISTTASAGLKAFSPVTITANAAGGVDVAGDLANARSAANAQTHIGCFSDATLTFCFAGNGAANGSCITTDPGFVALARSLNGDSALQFRSDANGRCTYIGVSNASYWAPKVP